MVAAVLPTRPAPFTTTALDDTTLVHMVGRGEQGALDEIYRRHAKAVLAVARRLTRDGTLAEDVAQDVFMGLWRSPQGYDPRRGGLRTYLATVARGRSIDVIRSEQARRAREERDGIGARPDSASAADEAFARQLGEDVRRALASLPARERDAIAMAYFGGHSYRQVAGLLGEPEGTVKSRIRTGISKLGEALRSAGWDR